MGPFESFESNAVTISFCLHLPPCFHSLLCSYFDRIIQSKSQFSFQNDKSKRFFVSLIGFCFVADFKVRCSDRSTVSNKSVQLWGWNFIFCVSNFCAWLLVLENKMDQRLKALCTIIHLDAFCSIFWWLLIPICIVCCSRLLFFFLNDANDEEWRTWMNGLRADYADCASNLINLHSMFVHYRSAQPCSYLFFLDSSPSFATVAA